MILSLVLIMTQSKYFPPSIADDPEPTKSKKILARKIEEYEEEHSGNIRRLSVLGILQEYKRTDI